MKRLIALLLLTFTSVTACTPSAVTQVLPQVIARVEDAAQILRMIDLVARPYFEGLPAKDALAKYDAYYQASLAALNVGLRAAQGTKDLTENQVDDGFDEFAVAYGELMTFLEQHGLVRPDGALLGDKPRVAVPKPLLVK